jgi:DNA-binding NarL/FixJ family response regulator
MKLLIVDDHSILREGVAEILRQGMPGTTVLQARGIEEGLSLAAEPGLAAILLDLHFPAGGGLGALPDFARRAPDVPVVILSSSEDPEDVRRALAQGAMGYVPKSASAQSLVSALRLVLSGNVYLPPLMADAPPRAPAERAALTGRQLEVLEAICQGLTNKDIGQQLDLSEKTVKAHVSAIFRALNVVNRTQAVNAARSARLIAP